MKRKIDKKGSALLVVLGFLSFMMVSAVSFAVYMRIEHQASSNFRHVTSSRHFLESALFQAMDELDSELRIESVNGVRLATKFPSGANNDDWQGRTLVSAVSSVAENRGDAHVLSLESLRYVPGIFINDLRRYAVENEDDDGFDLDTKEDTSIAYKCYTGAKWRPLTIPVSQVDGNHNAESSSSVGRFAYACLNVSDMLDVNGCRAALANANAVTNRISLNHLFNSDSEAQQFDDNYKNTDRYYDSLLDFYSCMDARNDQTFRSPWHRFVEEGNEGAFNQAAFEGKNVIIADSWVKAEPRASEDKTCNLKLATLKSTYNGGSVKYDNREGKNFTDIFENASKMSKALENALNNGDSVNISGSPGQLAAGMIADYLDTDNIPQLNLPSAERAPMICRVVLMELFRSQWQPKIETSSDGQLTTYYLVFPTFPSDDQVIGVETIYPFKDSADPSKNYTIELYANLHIGEGGRNQPFLTTSNGNKTTQYLTGNTINRQTSGNCCYHFIGVNGSQECKLQVATQSRNGGIQYLINNLQVKLEFVIALKKGNDYVDAVPFGFAQWSNDHKMEMFDAYGQGSGGYNKLMFHTAAIDLRNRLNGGNLTLTWDWSSLACPDPRFNWRAANWYQGSSVKEDPRTPAEVYNEIKSLIGQDGRDGDYFMSVSNAGYFQSPGEWGFIVRPYNGWSDGMEPVVDPPATSATGVRDASRMFRTIRLYEQGPRREDKIYTYFTYENENGSLDGCRVNPLSNIDNVLYAALSAVPLNYYYAAEMDGEKMKDHLFYAKSGAGDTASPLRDDNKWNEFKAQWFSRLKEAQKHQFSGFTVNNSYRYNLSDAYCLDETMGWWSRSGNGLNNTFKGFASEADIGNANYVSESDRKMLYSYTLDNFSDRQQLFLFIITAEATVPALGMVSDAGVKSLAGGRAVALVWRDPYPHGYDKETDSWYMKGQKKWCRGDSGNNYNRVSPWYQYFNETSDGIDNFGTDNIARRDGFHEMRVLFFRQLSN